MNQLFNHLIVTAWSSSEHWQTPETFLHETIAEEFQNRLNSILSNWTTLGMLSDGKTVYLSAERSKIRPALALEPLNVKWVKVEGVPIPFSLQMLSDMKFDLKNISVFVKPSKDVVEVPKTFRNLFGPTFDPIQHVLILDLDSEVFSAVARYVYQRKVL